MSLKGHRYAIFMALKSNSSLKDFIPCIHLYLHLVYGLFSLVMLHHSRHHWCKNSFHFKPVNDVSAKGFPNSLRTSVNMLSSNIVSPYSSVHSLFDDLCSLDNFLWYLNTVYWPAVTDRKRLYPWHQRGKDATCSRPEWFKKHADQFILASTDSRTHSHQTGNICSLLNIC